MIETDRLILSQAEAQDKAFFFELLNTPTWVQYIGDRGIRTEKDAQHYIENSLIKSYREKGYGLYKISLKIDNKPIGICGFVKRDYLDSVDIGFAILPEYEGKGYIAEAGKAVLDYGKKQLGIEKVYGITTHENAASQRVLKKLGLTYLYNITEDTTAKEYMVFSN